MASLLPVRKFMAVIAISTLGGYNAFINLCRRLGNRHHTLGIEFDLRGCFCIPLTDVPWLELEPELALNESDIASALALYNVECQYLKSNNGIMRTVVVETGVQGLRFALVDLLLSWYRQLRGHERFQWARSRLPETPSPPRDHLGTPAGSLDLTRDH